MLKITKMLKTIAMLFLVILLACCLKPNDRRYNKNKFVLHDYFFAKSLDKVRPGGIIAFVTSKGTMDKECSKKTCQKQQ